MPRTLARRSIPEEIAASLRDRILAGEFKAGEQLRQDGLAADYGVSRIPVREALRRLEAEGLVAIEPHKGAVVSGLEPAEIRELFEMRALLEAELIRLAVPRLTAADVAEAEAALNAYEAGLAAGRVEDWGGLNWRFHGALYRAAGRPRWIEQVQALNLQTDRFIRLQLALTGALDRARSEHLAILTLARAGEADDAAALVRRHILEAGEALSAALAQDKTQAAAE